MVTSVAAMAAIRSQAQESVKRLSVKDGAQVEIELAFEREREMRKTTRELRERHALENHIC